MCVEFSQSFVLGIIDGVRISNVTVCMSLAALMLASFLGMLLVTLIVRPALTQFQQWFLVLMNVVGTAAAATLLIALQLNSRSLDETTSWIAFVASMMGTAKFAMDVFAGVMAVCQQSKGDMMKLVSRQFVPSTIQLNDEDLEEMEQPLAIGEDEFGDPIPLPVVNHRLDISEDDDNDPLGLGAPIARTQQGEWLDDAAPLPEHGSSSSSSHEPRAKNAKDEHGAFLLAELEGMLGETNQENICKIANARSSGQRTRQPTFIRDGAATGVPVDLDML